MAHSVTREERPSTGEPGTPPAAVAGRGRRWAGTAAAGLLGCILGQALWYHHEAPFAWMALVLIWERDRRRFLPVLAAAAAGAALASGWGTGLALLGLGIVLIPLVGRVGRREWAAWPVTAGGAAGLFLVGQPWNRLALFWALVAGATAAAGYGWTRREWDRLLTGDADGITLLLLLSAAGAALAGMEGWRVGLVSPALLVGSLVVILGSVATGLAGGAVTGGVLGLTLALRGTDPAGGVGILVACGVAAGWGGQHHWRLAGPGLLLGTLAYAVLLRFPPHILTLGVSLALGAGLSEVLPPAWVGRFRRWTRDLTQGALPETLPRRLRQLALVLAEMGRAFHYEDGEAEREGRLVEYASGQVCRRCSLQRHCWEGGFYRSYRGLAEAIEGALEDGGRTLTLADVPGEPFAHCIHADALLAQVNAVVGREWERRRYRARMRESRQLAERQLAGIATLVGEMAERWAADPPPRRRAQRPLLDCEVAVAQRPRQGSSISGDAHLVRDLPGDRLVVGLSDGMGVGPRAAWESGTAVALLDRLLQAGFSQAMAVRAVNSTLLLRSQEDHFATLDLLLVDRRRASGELVKVAAAPTFLRRGNAVEVISGHTPPVGILPEVPVEPIFHTFEPGDLVVMVTDGVLDPDGPRGVERLRQFLTTADIEDPRLLAETVLSFMLGQEGDGRDDAAVLVLSLVRHGFRRARWDSGGRPRVLEWERMAPGPARG
ncbi:MAG: SpoIIE family protein phosphatase [Firmicutes bacterium]|nr:SpoIIE family protein phosphatase [Bacillota bacterium]